MILIPHSPYRKRPNTHYLDGGHRIRWWRRRSGLNDLDSKCGLGLASDTGIKRHCWQVWCLYRKRIILEAQSSSGNSPQAWGEYGGEPIKVPIFDWLIFANTSIWLVNGYLERHSVWIRKQRARLLKYTEIKQTSSEGFLLIFKLLSSVSRECRGNFFELQLNDVCARFNSFVFVDSHVVVYVCACPHCFMELRSRPAGKQRRINEDKACLKVRKPLISPNSLKYYAWFGEVWISL